MKIAIAGFGVEGQSSYDYWSKQSDAELTIVDQNEALEVPEGVATITGPDAFERLSGFDLVIRSAGLAPYKIKTDGKLWSATNEFFAKCPAPIVGVTGTKGKGTTSSMIASMFEASGRKTWLVGNIGIAAISVLPEIQPEDIVIYELSSFQLWDIQASPHVAVVLGIEPEHLDVHRDMADYVAAKGNIRRYQKDNDICIFNSGNDYARHISLLSEVGTTIPYGLDEHNGGHVKEGMFYVGEHIICSVEELQLKGLHNQENACAAIAAAHELGLTNDDIAAGLRNFTGLPHRLEFVRTIEGVDYYNDSFSSSTPATVAAIRAFTQPEIVIVGGIDRGGDFEHLASELKQQSNIKKILLIGDIRHKLADVFGEAGLPIEVLDAQTMSEIVHAAKASASSGDVIILSPGCASFDMFKNFSDRGDQFKEAVQSLGETGRGTFLFKSCGYDDASGVAHFTYGFENGPEFTERIELHQGGEYDAATFDRALKLAFITIGTSYYKTFPSANASLGELQVDDWQAKFINTVYQEGLSQFAFENELSRDDLLHVQANGAADAPTAYEGDGTLVLQSGGKDSLLVARLLAEKDIDYTPWYLTSSEFHPEVLDDLSRPLTMAKRTIDRDALVKAAEEGALNGHVPVTFIVQSIALLQAVLLGKHQVLVSIAHEGEEPHAMIGDLPVTHQWSKTWQAEQLFSEYVHRYVSEDVQVGSPLRAYSELRVAELFVTHAWEKYGHRFSSCNRANYAQGADNTRLAWCGECPKCANSFVLFAPFVDAEQLKALFNGQDLFAKPLLQETFKGLFGVDGVMKPFECVGEIDELRYAYGLAMKRGGYQPVSFAVPDSQFDYLAEYPAQDWAKLL
jgi:UDP-N-acetylmuramoylalanine--D-glutamate ligase